MAGFLAREAARIPERQTQPKDILEQDYWYEEETDTEGEVVNQMSPPLNEGVGASNDQVVPGLIDTEQAHSQSGSVTPIVTQPVLRLTTPQMPLRDDVIHQPTGHLRLSSVSRLPAEQLIHFSSLSGGSSSSSLFASGRTDQLQPRQHRQSSSIAQTNINESLVMSYQCEADGSMLPTDDPHVVYTQLASRYFEKSDNPLEELRSPHRDQASYRAHVSTLERIKDNSSSRINKLKMKSSGSAVSRFFGRESVWKTIPKGKRARIDDGDKQDLVQHPSNLIVGDRSRTKPGRSTLTGTPHIAYGSTPSQATTSTEPEATTKLHEPEVFKTVDARPTSLCRSPLENNFSVDIRLVDEERKLFGQFQYLYKAAAEKLSDTPTFPQGLVSFPGQLIRLRLDASSDNIERRLLLQLLCAGLCTRALLTATPVQDNELPSGRSPTWASLPSDLKYTFLNEFADWLRGRNTIVTFLSSSVGERFRLSEELRNRSVLCKFFSKPPSWETLDEDGVLLVPSIDPPIGHRQRVYDGVLLPAGAKPWPGIVCGFLTVESNLPPTCLPSICRTAFVNASLETLIAKMKRVPGQNGLPLTVLACPRLTLHDADLCSSQWALILDPGPQQDGRTRCRKAIKDALVQLCKRLIRVIKSGAYKQVTVLVFVNNLCPAVSYLAQCTEEKVGAHCPVKVVPVESKRLEEQLVALIEANGDDFFDYNVHIQRANKTLPIPDSDENADLYESVMRALRENQRKRSIVSPE